jgi:CarD family transcriptional regulator
MTRPIRSGSTARAVSPPSRSGTTAPLSPKPRRKRPLTPPEPVAEAPAAAAATAAAAPKPVQRPAMPSGYIPPPLSLTPTPLFNVGDKAVHPSHGVGEVTAIEQREIAGTRATFYILRILDNSMKVMVPKSAASQVGLRAIMSDAEANTILTTMRAREVAVDVQPWSRRFRVYTEMIKSGSAVEIAKVLRDMNRLKFDKELSFGERRLLDQARSLLLKELAFAKQKTEAEMAEEIRKIFS